MVAGCFYYCDFVCRRRDRLSLVWILIGLMYTPAAWATNLEQLIQLAMQNPAVQSQLAQERMAQADVERAKWQFYPTPSVTIENALTQPSDAAYRGDSTVAVLRLQQPVWSGGRLTAGQERADFQAKASHLAVEESRQQVALQVVQAYGDWFSAHQKLKVYEQSLARHEELRDRVLRRIDEGLSAESDQILVEARVGLLGADIALARTQRDNALVRLGQLTGKPTESQALITRQAKPRRVPEDVKTLLDEARRVNPAVQKAIFQAEMQKSAIEERRADLMPEIYLRVEQQYGNFADRQTALEHRLFMGATSRFGAGLSTLANVKSAEAQYQVALAEVEVRNRALQELIQSDFELYLSARQRNRALESSLKAVQGVLESFNRQFLSGRRSWLDVMNTARELAQTEAQWVDVQASDLVLSWRLMILAKGVSETIGTMP